MLFNIQQKDLSRALDTVWDVVPSKTAIPVLSHLLIEAFPHKNSEPNSGKITISATDLDISITTSTSTSVIEAGRITVPARKFFEIIRELPDGTLVVSGKDHQVKINRTVGEQDTASESFDPDAETMLPGQGVYVLMGLPSEDYPELPGDIEGTLIQFGENGGPDGNIIKDMISKTSFAVSRDETRPVLNGVLCLVRPEGITMVATDGHRLIRHIKGLDLKDSMKGKDQAEAIVPPRVLQHLVKLLSSHCTLKQCVIGSNHILFDLGQTRLVSRLIEGPYVDYEQVIPGDNTQRMMISKNAIAPSVRRVSILSNTQTHQIRIGFRKHEVELSAVSQEVGGEARESIQANYDGNQMDIGYNSAYLLDILKRIDSEDVIFDLNTPITAGIVRPAEQPEGEDYLCLLMPLRLSE